MFIQLINYEFNELYRAVRAMNETLKQNRLLREQGDDDRSGLQKNVRFFIAVMENMFSIWKSIV